MVISHRRPERLGELSIRGDASVRADCTAVTHHRRRNGCLWMAILAAILFAAGSVPAVAASSTASVDPRADVARHTTTLPYEIRMVTVPMNGEGLEFAARLAEDGGLILRPIQWRVRRQDGEIVYNRAKPVAAFDAEPGDYVVEASYGPLRLAETVTLVEGYRLGITFILNMGGIRVLPRLEGLGTPGTRTLTSIYATGGQATGKLVAISENPGEIVRLSAGRYRIESRFSPGNAVTTTEISVKPGLMSAVEVDHHAALARLALDTQEMKMSSGISCHRAALPCPISPATARMSCLHRVPTGFQRRPVLRHGPARLRSVPAKSRTSTSDDRDRLEPAEALARQIRGHGFRSKARYGFVELHRLLLARSEPSDIHGPLLHLALARDEDDRNLGE